jgi:phosphatidylglycerol:prolipoprotein diacylglycerol transferase
MCQTLFYIPAELFGLPMFGTGLLLAFWAIVSVVVIAWLAWRQGFNADTWGYVPVLVLIGAIIRWLLPALCDEHGLPIRGFGMMVFLAVTAGTSLAARYGRRAGVDLDTVLSLIFWILAPGIIGARAFHVIQYWNLSYWPAYTDPNGGLGPLIAAIISINAGGIVVYGAFIGGVAGLMAFARWRRLPLLVLCDIVAPSMALGLALGRIGCLLNGCCYGAACDHPWAITFPPGSFVYESQVRRGELFGFSLDADPETEPVVRKVKPDLSAARAGLKPGDRIESMNDAQITLTGQAQWAIKNALDDQQPQRIGVARGTTIDLPAVPLPARSLPVHPTQIYSAIDGLVLCLLLLAFTPFCRRDGELFALLISIYPITRFLIESLRSDEAAIFGTGMSISQNVSIVLLLGAAALWFYILRQPPRTKGIGPGLRPNVSSPNRSPRRKQE